MAAGLGDEKQLLGLWGYRHLGTALGMLEYKR